MTKTPTLARKVCKDIDLTQKALAHVCGVSPRLVSDWVRGTKEPEGSHRLILLQLDEGDLDLWPEIVATPVGEAREMFPDGRGGARRTEG